MPVNEFEKQVQQKMDELQLRPSTEVWEAVERRIRKEKNRRRFIIWFFIFVALLLGGAGWWIAGIDKKQTAVNNPVTQTVIDETTNKTTTVRKDDTVSEYILQNQTTTNKEDKKEKTAIELPNSTPATKQIAVSTDKKWPATENASSNKKKTSTTYQDQVIIKREKLKTGNPEPSKIVTKNQPELLNNNQIDKNIAIGTVINTDTKPLIKDSAADNIAIDKAMEQTINADNKLKENTELKDSLIAKETAPISKKDTSKVKKNKWELGINSNIGISDISDGLSFFGGQKSADAANNQLSSGGQGSASVAAPRKGFSWQLGLSAKRKLTTKTWISTGFNIAAYSTVQQTGVFIDSSMIFSNSFYSSSVRNFYRNGSAVSYTNHYYYLQIPFSFHWQINKGTSFPLVLQNGFSVGFLAGSDALVYSTTSNVFYRDNKLLNKVQLSYQAGLYTNLFKQSKKPMTAGILFNYHLNKLQKVNTTAGNHMASFGIQLGWKLKK